MSITMIAAVDGKGGIGRGGVIPWYLPNDLKFFRLMTSGHDVVMGMNTFMSLGFRPLSNRVNYVLTSKRIDLMTSEHTACNDNLKFINSVDEVLRHDLFVIGGASIYKQFMPLANKLYITSIDGDFKCDTFFPEINPEEWYIYTTYEGKRDDKNKLNHTFKTYYRFDKNA